MIQKTILASFTIPIGLLTTFIFWWLVLFAFDRITQLDIVPPTQGTTTTITRRAMASTMATNGTSAAPNTPAPTLPHAKINPRRSNARGHADHGWLNSYHTFSFASYHDPAHSEFGPLRVLNEDRVAPKQGFPTHPHRDFEIFSYILDGELTHRDSIKGKGGDTSNKNDFYVMKRGDLQFTTGGTGIAHSEQNEHPSLPVHFLQLWVKPWAKSLPPNYHTATFPESYKREGFVTLISPLAAGKGASKEQEMEATPRVEGTVPIHADVLVAAGIIPKGRNWGWRVGGAGDGGANNGRVGGVGAGAVEKRTHRRAYIHLPQTKGGKAAIRLSGEKEVELREGDGAYVSGLNVGDVMGVESVGSEEAEVVLLDLD